MRYLARTVGLAIVYLGAARIGLQYASLGGIVSLVWPATGVAIGALVLLGPRHWPGIAIGSFLALLSARLPVFAAAAMAAGSTIEALVAAHILRRLAGPHPRLDDPRHLRALLLVAAPGGAVFAAIIGATVLWAAARIPSDAVALAAGLLWAGNLLGALVVAPLFLRTDRPSPAPARRAIMEAALLCLGTVLAVQIGLTQLPADSVLRQIDYHYLLFPFVVWAALRFGARGAAAMTLTVSAVSVWRTFQSGTPFEPGTATGTLLAVASYLALVAATGLLLAASLRWERDRATRALLDSEERLRMAVDAARMSTWVWSIEDRALVADDHLRRLYDLSPGHSPARYADFRARVHPDDRDFVEASVEAALQSGGKMDHEFRVLLPDGRVRWIAEHGEVRTDAAGRKAFVAGVSMDVTERRGSEERLRQAHRMDLVGRLAGGVAHEANNQMSVILGSADFVLRRGDLSDPVRTDVEAIRRAAERTAAVTTQLLAFSRQQMLKPAILDVSDVVRQWSPVLMRVMGEDCPVGLRLDKNAGRVKADRGQLEQVLLNLAINARDAMPRGGMLTVETYTTELTDTYGVHKPGTFIKPGQYAVLAVSDTGEGMDQRTLGHAFEPFFTTKPVGQGTGLGLSTVYGIVKQSDGYVWIYSEPGRGTTCKIYLPLVATPILERETLGTQIPVSGGETILVVEDEPSVRAVVRRTLERGGYSVLEAESGEYALELAERTTEPISLIFTDVVMPGLDGPALVERLARLAPDAAVLYTSGYTDGEIVRRGLLGSDAAFLQKPVSPDMLLLKVREQLEAHQARRRDQ
jgi:PAS domain S-box-containing protein